MFALSVCSEYNRRSVLHFSEQGGAAALEGGGNTNGQTFSTLGARVAASLPAGNIEFTTHGSVGWQHAYSIATPRIDLTFSSGTVFGVTGAPLTRNAAVLEVGVEARISRAISVGLGYGGQFASGFVQNSLIGKLSAAF
jgi:outer membrane autotransporter protein